MGGEETRGAAGPEVLRVAAVAGPGDEELSDVWEVDGGLEGDGVIVHRGGDDVVDGLDGARLEGGLYGFELSPGEDEEEADAGAGVEGAPVVGDDGAAVDGLPGRGAALDADDHSPPRDSRRRKDAHRVLDAEPEPLRLGHRRPEVRRERDVAEPLEGRRVVVRRRLVDRLERPRRAFLEPPVAQHLRVLRDPRRGHARHAARQTRRPPPSRLEPVPRVFQPALTELPEHFSRRDCLPVRRHAIQRLRGASRPRLRPLISRARHRPRHSAAHAAHQ
mmetsp:Transcript_6155/g.18597  ORF Transcript_6155/g.18597 Transcript_6155/m.18597 type:complete len:276 (+) Transcript_6155:582-1409(+)